MEIAVFQHADYESPGAIVDWARARGHRLDTVPWHREGPARDPVERADALILMGGPMSIHDRDRLPWLAEERRALEAWLTVDRGPVLGICLGAQMLAHCLGGRVEPAPIPEMGWHSVTRTPEGRAHPLLAGLPDRFTPLHWHGERFTLPPGTFRLAASDAEPNQAFADPAGRRVGLQFHLEATAELAGEFVARNADRLGRGLHIQGADEIRRGASRRAARLRPLLHRLLDRLLESPTGSKGA